MQINSIKSYSYNPIFTSTLKKLPFSAAPLKCDTFERVTPEKSYTTQVEEYYDDLQKEMGILNQNDVVLMAKNIKKKVPDANMRQILYAMNVLSEYSSYKSWNNLKQHFVNWDIRNIKPDPTNSYKTNCTHGLPVQLTCVMNYLFGKNCEDIQLFSSNAKTGVILDSNLLSMYQKEGVKLPENSVPIYIENFENGYNFLNQSEKFEDFTARMIKKAKKYDDFEDGLYKVLNGENISKIKNLGIKPLVIKPLNLKISPGLIAEKLNPIIIDKNDFIDMLNSEDKFSKEGALKFMKAMNVFVTPKQFSENLKIMHHNINECAKQNGFENLYYLIPNCSKSFGLVNYMFQRINNIADDKFIYYNLKFSEDVFKEKFDFLPDNSTFVILDDCSISGSSIRDEQLYFKIFMDKNSDYFKNKSINFIIAPMYMAKIGKACLENVQGKEGGGRQSVVLPYKILPEVERYMMKEVGFSYMNEIFGYSTVTSFVLPYMGPDTNNSKFVKLYQKMLFSPNAQKDM